MGNVKLSKTQIEALHYINDNDGLYYGNTAIHGNTVNSLHEHGLLKISNYANCIMYEITDYGLDQLKKKP